MLFSLISSLKLVNSRMIFILCGNITMHHVFHVIHLVYSDWMTEKSSQPLKATTDSICIQGNWFSILTNSLSTAFKGPWPPFLQPSSLFDLLPWPPPPDIQSPQVIHNIHSLFLWPSYSILAAISILFSTIHHAHPNHLTHPYLIYVLVCWTVSSVPWLPLSSIIHRHCSKHLPSPPPSLFTKSRPYITTGH